MTEKRLAILVFIDTYTNRNGYPPTQTEIALACGITQCAVSKQVIILQRTGYLERSQYVRGYRVRRWPTLRAG